MKQVYACTLVATLLLLTAYKPKTNPINIEGHLRKGVPVGINGTAGMLVFVKGDGRVLAKTLTDNKGDFELGFLPHTEKSFDLFCTQVGLDTLFIASYKSPFERDLLYDSFFVPTITKTTFWGQTICPKCGKTDKVYRIVHSIAPFATRHVSNSGDTTYSPIYKDTYQEDCGDGGARYFCNRDSIKF